MNFDTKHLPIITGKYLHNYNLAKKTWFRVGGNVETLFKPHDIADLQFFLKNATCDINIVGACSNIVIRDNGEQGVIIKLGKNFAKIKLENNVLQVGAACLDYSVAMFCLDNNIEGLEFLSGIPGTIGGNLPTNAGAYGGEISDYLIKAEIVLKNGTKILVNNKDLGLGYRECRFLQENKGAIFTKAWFKAKQGDQTVIKHKIDKIKESRNLTQPTKTRTGGSTFKNPPNAKAWQFIDQVGGRGQIQGGAQVSEKHCNFFINTGNATATDIETLGEDIRTKINNEFGIQLEWEIKFL